MRGGGGRCIGFSVSERASGTALGVKAQTLKKTMNYYIVVVDVSAPAVSDTMEIVKVVIGIRRQ